MRLLAALVLGLACSASVQARGAFQALCEESMGRHVPTVTHKINGYTIDNTQSYKALSQRARGNPPPGTFVLGLTTTSAGSTIYSKSKVVRNPFSNYECVSAKIEATLFYEPAVIYVSSEFAPGSCAYKEILAHEMRHLNTYFDQLPKVETAVRAALTARFYKIKPVYAPRGETDRALGREFDDVWIPYLKKELVKVEKLQAKIDTPQEYARLSTVCQGAVQSLINYDARTSR